MDFPSLFFFFIEAMERNSILVFPSKQRFLKLRFLQKLGCQTNRYTSLENLQPFVFFVYT